MGSGKFINPFTDMIEYPRKFFKADHVMGRLFAIIKQRHRPAKHTVDILEKNKHIENFCEEARHYVLMPGKPDLHIHYDVESWYHPDGALCKIISIGVYDNFLEYEKARIGQITEGASLN